MIPLKKKLYFFVIFTVLLTISLLIIIIGSSYINKKEKELYHKKYENISNTFKDKIDFLIQNKKNATLVLTLTLSQNEGIKNFFLGKSKDLNLNKLSFSLRENSQFRNVWFQLINKDGKSLYRSWSDIINDKLTNIRPDIKLMLENKEIQNVISVGKYDMTFKSMVPIFEGKEFIGILESITHFNSISRNLRDIDKVEPIIIVEKRYTEQLEENAFTQIFLKNHYIANIDVEYDLLSYLENQNLNEFINIKNYKIKDERLVVDFPIISNNKVLAHFLLFKDLSDIDISDIKEFKTHAYWYLFLSILLLCMFLSVISYYLYTKELKRLYDNLDKNRTKLSSLNKNLRKTVEKEVLKNDEKNKILFQQAKMAAMGEMIENIAHQWRQPLSVITVSASSIKLKKEFGLLEDKEHLESLDSIINTSNYLSNTIDDFRYFFSPDKSKNEFSTTELIDKSLKLLQANYKKNTISIIKNIEDCQIITYENELIQVLINIFNNAKDELVKIEDINKRYLFIDLYKDNENIIIEIKDNAGGIKKEILDRIFEPYFTTKHKSNGTGIGLYMCEEIISKHINGSIIVQNVDYTHENCEYSGALFVITVPFK